MPTSKTSYFFPDAIGEILSPDKLRNVQMCLMRPVRSGIRTLFDRTRENPDQGNDSPESIVAKQRQATSSCPRFEAHDVSTISARSTSSSSFRHFSTAPSRSVPPALSLLTLSFHPSPTVAGGGSRSTTASRTFSTPSPLFALIYKCSLGGICSVSSICCDIVSGEACGRSILLRQGMMARLWADAALKTASD